MKKFFSIVASATIFSFGLAAQNNFEFGEDADFSIRKGAFSAETVSYVAFGDHNLLDVDVDFQNNKGKALTEFYMNIIELRVHPYETGMFTLGVDFDWDYYRLRNTYFWQPDASKEKVSIASMEGSGFKRIKKSRLSVRTLSVPIAFEQSFDKFTLRIGAAGEYNFPAISRFKGESRDGATVKEWKAEITSPSKSRPSRLLTTSLAPFRSEASESMSSIHRLPSSSKVMDLSSSPLPLAS